MFSLNWKKILYLNKIFFPDSFLVVIEVLFFKEYLNLNFLQFTTITSLTVILSMIFEIPSGLISDKFGRKTMLILGNIIDILGIGILIFSPFIPTEKRFSLILIIELIRVFGRALASGNFEILIYQLALSSNNNDVEFKTILTKSFTIGSILAAIAGFTSTLLYNLNPIIPITVDLFFKIIKFFTFWSLPNFLNKSENNNNNNLLTKNKTTNLEIINAIFIIIIFSLIFSVSRATFSLYQPIMEELNLPLSFYGILVFLVNVILFFINSIKLKEISTLKKEKIIFIVCIILLLQIPIIFIKKIKISLIKLFCIFIFFSLMQIIRLVSEGLSSYFINECIKNIENKTLFFSIYHTIISFVLVLSFQFLGIVESFNKNFTLTYILYCSLILIFILLFYSIGRYFSNAKKKI